jgi:hypothetical protein
MFLGQKLAGTDSSEEEKHCYFHIPKYEKDRPCINARSRKASLHLALTITTDTAVYLVLFLEYRIEFAEHLINYRTGIVVSKSLEWISTLYTPHYGFANFLLDIRYMD